MKLFVIYLGLSIFFMFILPILWGKVSEIRNYGKFYEYENGLNEIVHDLKTPATAQLRACELLLNGSLENCGQKELLVSMANSNRYMLDLINNILIYSKFRNNQIRRDFEVFNLNELIKKEIFSMKLLSAEKNCEIEFQSNRNEIFINASVTGIRRVLINLISNAVKFADSNSTVTVKTASDGKTCEFSVLNYGKYIKENDFQNIFKKYKSSGSYGNGLGLYISKLILSKHNSKITVKSSKTEGNCFLFRLQTSKTPLVINREDIIHNNIQNKEVF